MRKSYDIPPTELRVNSDKDQLSISFEDGAKFDLSAEFLRVLSPSAEVQGHSPEQRKTIGGKKNVRIVKLEPVGNYAVRITFDDTHDTGIYSWSYLYELGTDQAALWSRYLEELEKNGLNRD